MSAPFSPYALTLDSLTKQKRGTFETFVDPRKGKNKSYTMVDAVLSAFSVFFTRKVPRFWRTSAVWNRRRFTPTPGRCSAVGVAGSARP